MTFFHHFKMPVLMRGQERSCYKIWRISASSCKSRKCLEVEVVQSSQLGICGIFWEIEKEKGLKSHSESTASAKHAGGCCGLPPFLSLTVLSPPPQNTRVLSFWYYSATSWFTIGGLQFSPELKTGIWKEKVKVWQLEIILKQTFEFSLPLRNICAKAFRQCPAGRVFSISGRVLDKIPGSGSGSGRVRVG